MHARSSLTRTDGKPETSFPDISYERSLMLIGHRVSNKRTYNVSTFFVRSMDEKNRRSSDKNWSRESSQRRKSISSFYDRCQLRSTVNPFICSRRDCTLDICANRQSATPGIQVLRLCGFLLKNLFASKMRTEKWYFSWKSIATRRFGQCRSNGRWKKFSLRVFAYVLGDHPNSRVKETTLSYIFDLR